MLTFKEKTHHLYTILNNINDNYADSFKADILIYFDDFTTNNPRLSFLKNLNSFSDIENWINKLTSRIVMKESDLEVNEIIFDYIELG